MRDIPPHAQFLFRTPKGYRKQIWRSLRTADPKVAAIRAAEHNAWYEGILSKIGQGHVALPSIEAVRSSTLVVDLVGDDIKKVVDGQLEELTEEDWRLYRLGDFQHAYSGNEIVRGLAENDAALIFKSSAVRTALESRKFLVGDYDQDVKTLNGIIKNCRRIIHHCRDADDPAKKIEYLQAELDLEIAHQTLTTMQGRREALFREYADDEVERVLDKIIATRTKVTIGEKFQEYLNDQLANRSSRHQTTSHARIGSFVEFIGPKSGLENITKNDVTRYRSDVLDRLPKRPPNMALTNKQKIASVSQDGRELLSAKTKNLYLHAISAFFAWCVKMDYVLKNPVPALRYAVDKPKGKRRRSYTGVELNALFGVQWRSFQRSEPHKFWIPLIALYHGCRLREICQLRGADVFREDRLLGLRITEDDDLGTSVKNAASDRRIPVHAKLLELGFADYCKGVRPDVKLFPKLTEREDGAPAFSKWFRRYKEQCSVEDADVDFHSFRHTFREACREADVAYDVVTRIGGWKLGQSPEAAYGTARFTRLAEELNKIGYDLGV
ncbi:site-specific integrase [Parvularcula sp. LCG005]|uniref:site-specific integrase n=1 Tax=Parvularcula sp. LCG005 TaxID=3078805 RepID=UPI0039789D45